MSLKRKIGVTELPESLNPGKAIAEAICPIIDHFITSNIHEKITRFWLAESSAI